MTVKPTSREAAENMKPFTPVITDRIVAWVKARGEYGATREEISLFLNIAIQTVTPCVNNCIGIPEGSHRRQNRHTGTLRETTFKRPTTAGQMATVLVAVVPGEPEQMSLMMPSPEIRKQRYH